MAPGRSFTIRRACPGDATDLARLANALNVHEGRPPGIHTAAAIQRDVLGGDFVVFVAERDDRVVGYTIHHPTYNSDLGVRGMWGVDLYVEPSMRGQGVARSLIAAVAAHALARGYRSMWWNVRTANVRARRAYAAMGAREDDSREVHLEGEALEAIAAEAAPDAQDGLRHAG